jgi:hypothetical protein
MYEKTPCQSSSVSSGKTAHIKIGEATASPGADYIWHWGIAQCSASSWGQGKDVDCFFVWRLEVAATFAKPACAG